jgi:protein-disulfide isomerase
MTRTIAAALAFATCLGGCGGSASKQAESDESSPIAAEVGDARISEAELDDLARDRLFFRETRGGDPSRTYELREETLNAWIEDTALAREAAARGLAVDALIAEELAARGPVSDEEVAAFYQTNLARMQGRSLDDLADDIRNHLTSEREGEVRAAIVARTPVSVHLSPPRIEVSSSGPSIGPADAPVVLIEFADFQCPYCSRALPVIQALRERYPTQLRVVFRHLPLASIHPRARPAAEASFCAEQQGKFWEFHDRVFQQPDALADADLRAHAEQLGLDLAKFDGCLQSPEPAARIAADVAEATAAGITGTPAFVLNGVLIRGLQPPDAFAAMIDRELAAVAKAP